MTCCLCVFSLYMLLATCEFHSVRLIKLLSDLVHSRKTDSKLKNVKFEVSFAVFKQVIKNS